MRLMAIAALTGLQAPRRRKQRQNEWAKSLIGDILASLIGLGNVYTFTLVGELPLSEILLILCLPLLLIVNFSRLHLRKRRIGIILTLLLLWLLGQVVTDIYRSTPFHDWTRGQASIFVFFLDLIGLVILLKGNTRRQLIFLFSLTIGMLASTRIHTASMAGLSDSDEIKFIYSSVFFNLTAIVCCYFYKRGQYAIMGLLFLFDILFDVIFNLRNLTLTTFISACLLLPIIPERIGRVRILPPVRTRARIFVIVGITLLAGVVIGKTMTTLAASGVLGAQAQQKNQLQTSSGLGILLGGRPEILVSSRAVIDSPILGHGSWAKDMKYTRIFTEVENEFGFKTRKDRGEQSGYLIPSHSHLMGAWVDAGVLGGIFWIYILVSTMKAISVSVRSQLPLKPLYVSVFIGSLWDYVFSPFGGTRRMMAGFLIVLICDILDPDPPAKQVAERTFARDQLPQYRRNLGRVASGL
jgi:hypothetical protein